MHNTENKPNSGSRGYGPRLVHELTSTSSTVQYDPVTRSYLRQDHQSRTVLETGIVNQAFDDRGSRRDKKPEKRGRQRKSYVTNLVRRYEGDGVASPSDWGVSGGPTGDLQDDVNVNDGFSPEDEDLGEFQDDHDYRHDIDSLQEPPLRPDSPVVIAADIEHQKWKMENRYHREVPPALQEPCSSPSPVMMAPKREKSVLKNENMYQSDTPPALPAPRQKSSLVSRMSVWSQKRNNRSQRDALPVPPVPEKKRPIDGDKRNDHEIGTLGNNFRNVFIDRFVKNRSPTTMAIAVLIVSAILIIIGVGIFIIALYAGGPSVQVVTEGPPPGLTTMSSASIVIVGVELDATVKLSNRAFIPQYNNDLSPQYQDLSRNFTNMMDGVFYNSDLGSVYNGTVVNGFSAGSVIVLFQVRLLSPPVSPDSGETSTPAGSIDDRIRKVEESVKIAVRDVIEDAADDGSLDELGVDSTSLLVTNVGVDVQEVTEAPIPVPATVPSDTAAPVIYCPDDWVVYIKNGQETANISWGTPNATDDSGQVSVTPNMEPGLWPTGDHNVVLTAADPSGNSAHCSFNIMIIASDCAKNPCRNGATCQDVDDHYTCTCLDGFKGTQCEIAIIMTDTQYYYRYSLPPIPDEKSRNFSFGFRIKAGNDIHIGMGRSPQSVGADMYEIVIGGWANTRSVIRRCWRCTIRARLDHSPLDSTEFRDFRVSYDNGAIRLYTGAPPVLFLEYIDLSPRSIGAVGISTGWGSTGEWEFNTCDFQC